VEEAEAGAEGGADGEPEGGAEGGRDCDEFAGPEPRCTTTRVMAPPVNLLRIHFWDHRLTKLGAQESSINQNHLLVTTAVIEAFFLCVSPLRLPPTSVSTSETILVP